MSINIKDCTIGFFRLLSTKGTPEETAGMMHDSLVLYHNDLSPMAKKEFIDFWANVLSESPGFSVSIKDIIAEGSRVWVFSCVQGRLGEGQLDDIPMMHFDENGKLFRSRGIQRLGEGIELIHRNDSRTALFKGGSYPLGWIYHMTTC